MQLFLLQTIKLQYPSGRAADSSSFLGAANYFPSSKIEARHMLQEPSVTSWNVVFCPSGSSNLESVSFTVTQD